MSIATKTGDEGKTSLIGGTRVSKADLRVEAYGTVDELNSFLGFARSLCTEQQVAGWTETIQRMLFRVGGALAGSGGPAEPQTAGAAGVTEADVAFLTGLVHQIESEEGILSDWSLPGAHRESAAFEMARTVCRRAERCVVRLGEAGEPVAAEVIAFMNRLSDLLWLFGRRIERSAGVDSRLRDQADGGRDWSRAW